MHTPALSDGLLSQPPPDVDQLQESAGCGPLDIDLPIDMNRFCRHVMHAWDVTPMRDGAHIRRPVCAHIFMRTHSPFMMDILQIVGCLICLLVSSH